MIPINVTHQAIFTPELFTRLCPSPTNATADAPPPTALRRMLETVLTFFAATYKSTFGFDRGPPLHDALTIAYLAKPELFQSRRYRVDVEMSGVLTAGETVVDIWNYRKTDDSWGVAGKNCLVAQEVDVSFQPYLRFGPNDGVGLWIFRLFLRDRRNLRQGLPIEPLSSIYAAWIQDGFHEIHKSNTTNNNGVKGRAMK